MERLSLEQKKALSDLRFEKARRMLEEAQKTFRDGMHQLSINRSYYAVLHASRSLLILEGIDPQRHDGVLRMLSLQFVKEGSLPPEITRNFKLLLSLRTDVDYADMESIYPEDAEDAIEKAEGFLEAIDGLRKRLLRRQSRHGRKH
jgi:hypothetical protein